MKIKSITENKILNISFRYKQTKKIFFKQYKEIKQKKCILSLMVFSFLPKNVHFTSKNAIWCLFFKNVSPSKRVVGGGHCFLCRV